MRYDGFKICSVTPLSSRGTCVELATKFDKVCACAVDDVGKAVYEEEPDDLFQTAASLTGHH